MDQRLIQEIAELFESKTTEELLLIWAEEDRNEYSGEAFEAVRRILGSRGHPLPPKKTAAEMEKEVQGLPAGPRGSEYVCTECYATFDHRGALSRSFLAFPQFKCPQCSRNIRYPLTEGYRTFYWVFIVGLSGASFCTILLQARYAFLPGVLWFAAVWALMDNAALKGRVRKAWYMHERNGPPSVGSAAANGAVKPVAASVDAVRWYHIVIAILFPYWGVPLGIVDLLRGQRRSGKLLIILSVAFLGVWVIVGAIIGLAMSER